MQNSLAGMLKSRPAVYRSFGPWWWPLKAQLVGAGLLAGELDPDLSAAVSTGDAVLDMAGAVAYHGFNLDAMRDTNHFDIGTESGDTVAYVLYDEQFER